MTTPHTAEHAPAGRRIDIDDIDDVAWRIRQLIASRSPGYEPGTALTPDHIRATVSRRVRYGEAVLALLQLCVGGELDGNGIVPAPRVPCAGPRCSRCPHHTTEAPS